MKLELIGHDEKYAVEQSLLTLFPDERPVYGPVTDEDASAARITLTEDADSVCVTTELRCGGKAAADCYSYPLSGTDYEKEGQRRLALGLSFFRAAKEVLGVTPAWGSLTGVRPSKVAVSLLREGKSPAAVLTELEEVYSVTPRRARLALEAAETGLRVQNDLKPNDISLYVGIPFCPTRCAYCSFVAQSVEKSFALVEPYLAALFDEIEQAGAMVRSLGLHIKSFYMGGGTPTTLTAEQMDRLLTRLERSFDFTSLAESTIEAGRPDTIDPEKLAVLRAHGVTRVSVNPQTMEDRVLAAIGRRHTADDIRRAMREVMAAGFPHVNMDLIAGLPEDTPEGFRRSLDEVLSMGADNITVHTLSLKKGSRITLEGSRIPSADEVAEMLDYADPTLRKHGFEPYYLYRQKYMSGSFENVGWTRPGGEGLYNIYIMEELHHSLPRRGRLDQDGRRRADPPRLQRQIPPRIHRPRGEAQRQPCRLCGLLSRTGGTYMTYSSYCESADFLRTRLNGFTPEALLILGSGLGFLGDAVEDPIFVDYGEVPHFRPSTAPGHKGRFVFGTLRGRRVAVMQGRMHCYEGYTMAEAAYVVRVVRLLGAKTLFVTNAAGCVNTDWNVGELMLLSDHIKLFDFGPLYGPNLEEFGTRFPDMSSVYTPRLRVLAHETAKAHNIPLREGVYMYFPGPQFETPAEVRAARVLGADAVGMSTVPETIVAAHCGMEVMGVTLLANMAAGVLPQPLSGAEVNEAAEAAAPVFSEFLLSCLESL